MAWPAAAAESRARGLTSIPDWARDVVGTRQVAYDTPWSTVTQSAVAGVVSKFSRTLTHYGHAGLGPRRYRSPAYDDRADMALVTLVRRCPRLKRLVVRDRVSTATLIVLAADGTQTTVCVAYSQLH